MRIDFKLMNRLLAYLNLISKNVPGRKRRSNSNKISTFYANQFCIHI